MNVDTLSYASVIRAFESVGYQPDSCLTQHQYSVCLERLVKRKYPHHSFDEELASELFEQNDKGFDNAVKVSSYAMTVVTAFQILVERILQETTSIERVGDATEKSESLQILKASKRDSENLLMAFGQHNTEAEDGPLPQVNISRLMYASTNPSLQPSVVTQLTPTNVQVTPQIMQPPVTIQPRVAMPASPLAPPPAAAAASALTQQMLTLLILTGSLALIQLVMSRHKYHFMNLPAALSAFAVVGSKFRNKPMVSFLRFSMSVAVVLSIYWLIEVAVSPRLHEIFGSHADIYDPQPAAAVQVGGVIIQPAPGVQQVQAQVPVQPVMVCVQQPDGRCLMVQQQPQVVQQTHTDPTAHMHTNTAIHAVNPTQPSPRSEFALQFILFLIADAMKIVTCIYSFAYGEGPQVVSAPLIVQPGVARPKVM